MATVEELLQPISEGFPCGEDVRYSVSYDKIKEARRAGGDWLSEGTGVDYALVTRLCEELLLKKSKDLQVAVWLADAWLAKQGLTGLLNGLRLVTGLIENYWDAVFPELEDGDAGLRLAPLDWMGSYLDLPVRGAALSKAGHGLIQYKEAQLVGMAPDPEKKYDDPEWSSKSERYETAVSEGKLTGEAFEAGFAKSSKEYYVKLADEVQAILDSLETLQSISEQRFTDEPPSFQKIRTAMEEIQMTVGSLLRRKRELEPDPEAEPAEEEQPAEAVEEAPSEETTEEAVTVARVKKKPKKAIAGLEPESVEEVAERLSAIAVWMRAQNAYDPAPYLLLRGYRWGELRAADSTAPDAALLDAPQTDVRTQIKRMAMESNWEEVIRLCEEVMASTAGRGWLDLQRYIVTACENQSYYAVANAVKSSLKSLLLDMPDLLNMTLMDDTAVANSETQQWIKDNILPPPPPEPEPAAEPEPEQSYQSGWEEPAPAPPSMDGETAAESREPDAYELAQEALRSGDKEQAIEILVRELGQERSGRGRFHRKMQLAQICLAIGRQMVARPILEELTAEIEKRRLDEWEPSDMVAHTLALLYRCMDGEDERKKQIYAWICRLDPAQAIACLK
ncbi:MAG: type VI secretion system protein TssA [Acidobacteria bacterium]|nr:type VI secretion system protein TssA [Acidobacteriota bacterium]